MVYEFDLIKGKTLPIFLNRFGNIKNAMNICFDTGCGITTLYMDEDTAKILFPNIQKTSIDANLHDANGGSVRQDLYIIPDFVLKDNNHAKLHIRNLYCCLSNANMHQIDILLSGAIFLSLF